jgi:hypothetical protein
MSLIQAIDTLTVSSRLEKTFCPLLNASFDTSGQYQVTEEYLFPQGMRLRPDLHWMKF